MIDFQVFAVAPVSCRLYVLSYRASLQNSGRDQLLRKTCPAAGLRTFFAAECAALHKMFSPPVRNIHENGEVYFSVQVSQKPMGIRLQLDKVGLKCDWAVQPKFASLQRQILSELVKERALFKNPPSVESLEAITPNWGFIRNGTNDILSPYTSVKTGEIKAEMLPCFVDFQLINVEISRTTIRPLFNAVYVGPVAQTGLIDFDWTPKLAASDLEEISDVPTAEEDGTLTLMDPAVKAREKAAAKAVVKAAFVAAEKARAHAEKLVEDFEAKYDLSDSESAFSEWLSEDEDD